MTQRRKMRMSLTTSMVEVDETCGKDGTCKVVKDEKGVGFLWAVIYILI